MVCDFEQDDFDAGGNSCQGKGETRGPLDMVDLGNDLFRIPENSQSNKDSLVIHEN